MGEWITLVLILSIYERVRLSFNFPKQVFYNEASGCITVYDVTRPSTLEAVAKWKEEIDTKVQLPNGKPIPCVLFANKVQTILKILK